MSKQMNIPKLRFPEFTGEWERKKLGEICKMQAGKFINASDINANFEINNYPCYGGNGLRGYTKSFNQEGRFSLIGRQGANCGNVTLANDKFYATEHAVVVKLVEELDTDFIFYILINLNLNQYSTGLAQPGLSVQNIEKVESIISNSLQEQQKIASFLTAVDEKLQALKKKKNLLEEYKKGVMQKLFSQELRFKDENGEDFPEWEVKKLGEVGTFFSGGTPLTTKRQYFNGNIPFIRSGEINANTTEQYISEEGLKNSSAKMVEIGDLIYALYGATSGEVAISKIKGAINQAILCIRTNLNNTFLLNYLILNKEIILKTYLQGGQGNLSAEIIKSLEIPVPTLPEQTRIANFLSSIDEKINHCQKQIEQTEFWKKGLLQKMFV